MDSHFCRMLQDEGVSITDKVTAATRGAPVLTIGGTSYSATIANRITWAGGTTASLSGDHMTIVPPSGGGTIANGTVAAGSLQATGTLTAAQSLQVSANTSVVGTLYTNAADISQLTVTSNATIPGYPADSAYSLVTEASAFVTSSGSWTAWPNAVADGMTIGTTGHLLYSATTGVSSSSTDTVTYLKKALICY